MSSDPSSSLAQQPSDVSLPDDITHSTARGGTRVPHNVLRAIYRDDLSTPPTPLPTGTSSRKGASVTTRTSTATVTATATATSDTSTATAERSRSKSEEYDESLKAWWKEYANRKRHDDEHASDTLLYDHPHPPRMAPASNPRDDGVRQQGKPADQARK